MLKKGKWIKTLVWHGKTEEVECVDHSLAWSGKIPCSGRLKCIFCGYSKDTYRGE